MEVVTTFLEGALRYIGTIAISDWLDIVLMALLLYRALRLVGRTRAANLGRVVVYFLIALVLSDVLHLNSINFILKNILTWGVLGLIILFQPELRRLLEQVGSSKLASFNPFARVQQKSVIETAIAQTVDACADMSESHTGVLMQKPLHFLHFVG